MGGITHTYELLLKCCFTSNWICKMILISKIPSAQWVPSFKSHYNAKCAPLTLQTVWLPTVAAPPQSPCCPGLLLQA